MCGLFIFLTVFSSSTTEYQTPSMWNLASLAITFLLIIAIVFFDAKSLKRKGASISPIGWAFLVFILNIFSIFLYVIFRVFVWRPQIEALQKVGAAHNSSLKEIQQTIKSEPEYKSKNILKNILILFFGGCLFYFGLGGYANHVSKYVLDQVTKAMTLDEVKHVLDKNAWLIRDYYLEGQIFNDQNSLERCVLSEKNYNDCRKTKRKPCDPRLNGPDYTACQDSNLYICGNESEIFHNTCKPERYGLDRFQKILKTSKFAKFQVLVTWHFGVGSFTYSIQFNENNRVKDIVHYDTFIM